MSIRLKIPDHVVGKYVQRRFDTIMCNLYDDAKLQIIEYINASCPDTYIQIISRTFENDTIEVSYKYEIDNYKSYIIDYVYITCVSDELCIFEIDIQSVNDNHEYCNLLLSVIRNGFQFDNPLEKYAIVYSHNLFY